MPLLKKLVLKFGAAPKAPPLECQLGTVTIFVGPNNSGKSRALDEIDACVKNSGPSGTRIVSDFDLSLPDDSALQGLVLGVVSSELRPLAQEVYVGTPGGEFATFTWAFSKPAIARNMIENNKLDPKAFARRVERGKATSENEAASQARDELRASEQAERMDELARTWIAEGIIRLAGYSRVVASRVIVLNGATRLSLVEDTEPPDWRAQDDNQLVNLLKQPERIRSLRDIIRKLFGSYPVVDTTSRTTQLKMANEDPGDFERSSTPEAIAYFDRARPIHAFSDGVKSFIGVLAAVLGNEYKLVLIDEPEAFLHPPLARTLGTELHRLARERRSQVVAATHSPDFLMGCIQASTDVNIIRLTYKNEEPTARLLSFESLRKMMRDPLLRSTGILGALFHEGAVVCESDSDRAFYQEINERLLAEERGGRGVAFLNAQNKQTLSRIIAPLREMGIPAAVIVDLDVIGKSEDLSRLLDAARVGPVFRANILNLKKNIFEMFLKKAATEEDAKKRLKLEGLGLLSERERREMRQAFFEPLEQHGIFIVPGGELESWLPALVEGVGRVDKAKWLTKIFERMGDDPEHPDYARPQGDDVWAFMDRVAAWIASPESGIPTGE